MFSTCLSELNFLEVKDTSSIARVVVNLAVPQRSDLDGSWESGLLYRVLFFNSRYKIK